MHEGPTRPYHRFHVCRHLILKNKKLGGLLSGVLPLAWPPKNPMSPCSAILAGAHVSSIQSNTSHLPRSKTSRVAYGILELTHITGQGWILSSSHSRKRVDLLQFTQEKRGVSSPVHTTGQGGSSPVYTAERGGFFPVHTAEQGWIFSSSYNRMG